MYAASVSRADLESAGLPQAEAAKIHAAIDQLCRSGEYDAAQIWSRVTDQVLTADQPFRVHALLFRALYSGWPSHEKGPPLVWVPKHEDIAQTNLAGFMAGFQGNQQWQQSKSGDATKDWSLFYKVSCSDPEVFWPPVLKHLKIPFHSKPTRTLELADHPDDVHWLPGARFNIAEAALCNRGADATAVTWADESAPSQLHRLSLGQLKLRCQAVAAALRAEGFKPGDAIAINMPMTVEAVVIYLGIIYAGCAAVSIADSFAPSEISSRLQIAHAKAIFVQDVILRGGKAHPLYERVTKANGPTAIVLPAVPGRAVQVQLRDGDMSYDDFLSAADPEDQPKPHVADAQDTCNILFSSGTTGQPKAIPWTHTTPIRSAANAFFHQDVRTGDTVAWPTNLGWMMGPWLVFAALLNGATIALFQGSPLGRPFGEFIQIARVSMLGLVPSIAKAWRASDCMKGLKWDKLRCFSSTGEASSPEDYHWLVALAGYKPVIEYCGGTEIGGAFLGGTLVQPQAPSHFSTPTIGCRLALLDDQKVLYDSLEDDAGDSQAASSRGTRKAVSGELALVPPLLGSSQRLLNKSHSEVYYEGMPSLGGALGPLRRHGDEVERLPGGFYVAHGRCDDTMNLGGIKVSSVELERVVVASVPAVMEAAAVGLTAPGGGPEQLIMFLVLHQAPATSTLSTPNSESTPHHTQSQSESESHASQSKPHASQAESTASQSKYNASQAESHTFKSNSHALQSDSHVPDSQKAGADQAGRSSHGASVAEGVSGAVGRIQEAVEQVQSAAAAAAAKMTNLAAAVIKGEAADALSSEGQHATSGHEADLHQLKLQCQQAIRSSLNPLFKLERVLLRHSLPRTASNKVMRRLLRDELRQTSAKL